MNIQYHNYLKVEGLHNPFSFSTPKKSPGGKFWKTLRELYILLYEKILGGIYYEKRNENQNGKGDGQTYRGIN